MTNLNDRYAEFGRKARSIIEAIDIEDGKDCILSVIELLDLLEAMDLHSQDHN